MSTIRQDAWSDDEDLLLAETVLRHIREGSTQLVAFEEVGKALSRTSAACGFRWNSLVRKKYENAIILAKKQRKELQHQKKTSTRKNKAKAFQKKLEETPVALNQEWESDAHLDLEHIISYLKTLKDEESVLNKLRKENQHLKEELEQEKKRANEEQALHQKVMKEFESVRSEYRAMLSIMEKARKLAGAYEERVPEKVNE
jgi:prespore-specific regulator